MHGFSNCFNFSQCSTEFLPFILNCHTAQRRNRALWRSHAVELSAAVACLHSTHNSFLLLCFCSYIRTWKKKEKKNSCGNIVAMPVNSLVFSRNKSQFFSRSTSPFRQEFCDNILTYWFKSTMTLKSSFDLLPLLELFNLTLFELLTDTVTQRMLIYVFIRKNHLSPLFLFMKQVKFMYQFSDSWKINNV